MPQLLVMDWSCALLKLFESQVGQTFAGLSQQAVER